METEGLGLLLAEHHTHTETNRHEGEDIPWASLHKYTRSKYRGKAYSALVSIGLYRAT